MTKNYFKIRLDLFPKLINDLIYINKKYGNANLVISLGNNCITFEYFENKYSLVIVENLGNNIAYLKHKNKIVYTEILEFSKNKQLFKNIIFYINKEGKYSDKIL